MKNLIANDKVTIASLADRLKLASSHGEYQRIQCVLIRATLGSKASEIAQLLGWSTATVHAIDSRYAKEGEALFDLAGRGGRHHQHMSIQQETQRRHSCWLHLRKRPKPADCFTIASRQRDKARIGKAGRKYGGGLHHLPNA